MMATAYLNNPPGIEFYDAAGRGEVMDYPPVLNKADFVRRYAAGEFGNASPTWQTLNDWLWDTQWQRGQENDCYHIRNRVAGGKTFYNIPWHQLDQEWNQLSNPKQWYISAMAPSTKTLLQGEVMQAPWGLELTYNTEPSPMREGMAKAAKYTRGLPAFLLLQRFMDPNSYDWLWALFERYPDHVVEFSSYSVKWGTLPGFNTVFWEVRKY
jgi:hypothetical protein